MHRLSSPGISLLEEASPEEENEASKNTNSDSKKFFTSRSNEAATVTISKAIKLQTINGEISISQRQRNLEKKNIGRRIEAELENLQSLDSLKNKKLQNVLPSAPQATSVLPSPEMNFFMSSKPVAKPTRFIVESPKKKNTSVTPLKERVSSMNLSSHECQKITNIRRLSPRKHAASLDESKTPTKGAIKKMPSNSPKIRNSPRNPNRTTHSRSKENTPVKAKKKLNVCEGDANSDTVNNEDSGIYGGDEILSELFADNELSGNLNTSARRSPRKSPRKELQNVKYFPVFDPARRKSDDITVKKGCERKKFLGTSDPNQMIIDAGQKAFGAVYCKSCAFLYEAGDPAEEKMHKEYHERIEKSLHFPGWKHERIVRLFDNGDRILKIVPKDSLQWWRKVETVLDTVNQELGFPSQKSLDPLKDGNTVYLYVKSSAKIICGCLVAEEINQAYKFIQQVTGKEGKLLCCSGSSQKAFIGVSRIWISPSNRKLGIATALVDCMRSSIYNNTHYVDIDEFAFSDPTEQGIEFARRYTNKEDFLVYRRAEINQESK